MPNRPSRFVSQQQIAVELGCSQSLVSKVLNGHHAGIPDDTVRQVWNCASAHGYRPRGANLERLVAESVAAPMIGFVLRSPLRLATESHIFHHAQQGMHEYLARRDVRTVFLGTESELDAAALRSVVQRHQLMLGLVLMGEVKPDFMAEVARCGKPVVLVSARYPGLAHSVLSNLLQAGELLVGHLHGLGHRRFGWIGSRHSANSLTRHKEAVLRALASRGLTLDPGSIVEAPEASRHCGHAAAGEIIGRNHLLRPTAIICFSAMMARGAINRLFQEGCKVPRDFSIAAFDMTQVCMEEPPHITSASAVPETLGAQAAQLVLSHVECRGEGLCEVVLPATLAVRDTTGPVPGNVPLPRRTGGTTRPRPSRARP